jgi:hypothetical protein
MRARSPSPDDRCTSVQRPRGAVVAEQVGDQGLQQRRQFDSRHARVVPWLRRGAGPPQAEGGCDEPDNVRERRPFIFVLDGSRPKAQENQRLRLFLAGWGVPR